MLVACRLAGLSALEAHYAGVNGRAQRGRRNIRSLQGGPAGEGLTGARDNFVS
jgi:hypothetical protein